MMNTRSELEADKIGEQLRNCKNVELDPGPDMPVNPAVIQPNVSFVEDVIEDDAD